jgi:hypothetical protein
MPRKQSMQKKLQPLMNKTKKRGGKKNNTRKQKKEMK